MQSTNPQPIDLTSQVKSADWFHSHQLHVKKGSTEKKVSLVVVEGEQPILQQSYFSALGTAISARFIGISDPTHIYSVSAAINEIAKLELEKSAAPIKGNEKEELNRRIERLINLLENLKNHETEVERYNQIFFLPQGYQPVLHQRCPDHLALLSKIGQAVDRLRNQLARHSPLHAASSKVECQKIFQLVRSMKHVDAQFIASSYPAFRQKLLESPLHEQQGLEEELNTLINERFVPHLQAALANPHTSIPTSLVKGCEILGFDQQWIESSRIATKDRLIELIGNWLNNHVEWKTMSPNEIVKNFQTLMGQAVVERMPLPPEIKGDAAHFLETMRVLEVRFNRRVEEEALFQRVPIERLSSGVTYARFLEEALHLKPLSKDDLKDPVCLKKALENLTFTLGTIDSAVEGGFIFNLIQQRKAEATKESLATVKASPGSAKEQDSADKLRIDFEHSLALLDQRLADQFLPCTTSFILATCSFFEEKLQKVPFALQKNLRESLYGTLNRHFIDYVTNSLLDPQTEAPRSMGLFIMTVSDQILSEDMTRDAKESFNAKIKEWMLQSGGEWSTLDPRLLVRQFQEWMIDAAFNRMNIPHDLREEIKDTLIWIRQTELETSRKMMTRWEGEKQKILSSLPDNLKDDLHVKRQILQFDPSPDFVKLVYDSFLAMKSPFNQIDLKQTDKFKIKLSSFKKEFLEKRAEYDRLMDSELGERIQDLKQTIFTFDIDQWLNKHSGRQLFEYSQDMDGEEYIFQSGICAGINFRWIINLMERDPSLPITSFHDLEKQELHSATGRTIENYPGSFRTKHSEEGQATLMSDRFRQARSIVAMRMDYKVTEQTNASGARTVRSRARTFHEALYDGTKYHPETILPPNKQFLAANFFSSLMEKEKGQAFLKNSKGILQVNIFSIAGKDGVNEASAHALGIEVDSAKNSFKFWDVNTGMYEFDSLIKLEEAFKEYTARVYHDLKYVYCIQPVRN